MMVIEIEARLKQKLIVNDLETCIIAVMVSVTATTIVDLFRKVMMEEKNDITDDISFKGMSIILQFADLS